MSPGRVERADTVLARLVRSGTLTAAQAYAVKESLADVLAQPDEPPEPAQAPRQAPSTTASRNGWVEVAGYLGGALVAAAAALFLVENYGRLTETEMALWQGAAAVLLLATAATMAALTPGGARKLRQRDPQSPHQRRRRLTSTLATLGAAASAGSAGFAAPPGSALLWAGLAATWVAAIGYALVPATVGLVGTWAASVLLVGGIPGALDLTSPLAHGLAILAVGLVWAAAATVGRLHEGTVALALGAATALAGAQATAEAGLEWAYGLTAVLAVLAFALYPRLRVWPLIALGVASVTLAVPEALTDLTDNRLGVVGGLMAAGVGLIAASALGLRIRAATPGRDGPQP